MSVVTYEQRRKELQSDISGVVPTVPTAPDHTHPSWLVTDIYLGEIFVNVADDRVFTRTINGIVEITAALVGSGSGIKNAIVDTTTSDSTVYQHDTLIGADISKVEMWINSVRVPLRGYDAKQTSNNSAAGSITFSFVIKNDSSILIHIY